MGIQSFVPAGGGGTPGFDYIASVRMETYARSWAQAGASGNYIMSSNNLSSGYVYFVGTGATTGGYLNKVINVPHAFTSINMVAPAGDYLSLSKAAVKSTTEFSNPFAAFTQVPAIINASGNFILPNVAMPIADVLIVGGGGSAGAGHGGAHGGGGGGGGGNVVYLTGVPVAGATGVTVGSGGAASGSNSSGNTGGSSYFGNVYAYGGGGGGSWNNRNAPTGLFGNGGGACVDGSGAAGTAQTASTGLGTLYSPVFSGGFSGGSGAGGTGDDKRGGGGGGAAGNGSNGGSNSGGAAGAGYVSTITGVSQNYGQGGAGATPNGGMGSFASNGFFGAGGQGTTNGHANSSGQIGSPGNNGVVIVRYYLA
jgi:hypothetical protein